MPLSEGHLLPDSEDSKKEPLPSPSEEKEEEVELSPKIGKLLETIQKIIQGKSQPPSPKNDQG